MSCSLDTAKCATVGYIAFATVAVVSCGLVIVIGWHTQGRDSPEVRFRVNASVFDHHDYTIPEKEIPRKHDVSVVACVMITSKVDARLVNAFHYSIEDVNRFQSQMQIELRFFVGKEGHPMLDTHLAHEHNLVTNQYSAQLLGELVPNLPVFVRGDFPENMNDGKTFEWLRYAASAFPNSHWILKIDSDAAPVWMKLQQHLLNTTNELRYLGVVLGYTGCGSGAHCPPQNCSDFSGSCWVYMQGALYGVSTRIAQLIAQCEYAAANKVGFEDLVVGKMIKNCVPNAHETVQIIRLQNQAWCHSKVVNVTHIRNNWLKGC